MICKITFCSNSGRETDWLLEAVSMVNCCIFLLISSERARAASRSSMIIPIPRLTFRKWSKANAQQIPLLLAPGVPIDAVQTQQSESSRQEFCAVARGGSRGAPKQPARHQTDGALQNRRFPTHLAKARDFVFAQSLKVVVRTKAGPGASVAAPQIAKRLGAMAPIALRQLAHPSLGDRRDLRRLANCAALRKKPDHLKMRPLHDGVGRAKPSLGCVVER